MIRLREMAPNLPASDLANETFANVVFTREILQKGSCRAASAYLTDLIVCQSSHWVVVPTLQLLRVTAAMVSIPRLRALTSVLRTVLRIAQTRAGVHVIESATTPIGDVSGWIVRRAGMAEENVGWNWTVSQFPHEAMNATILTFPVNLTIATSSEATACPQVTAVTAGIDARVNVGNGILTGHSFEPPHRFEVVPSPRTFAASRGFSLSNYNRSIASVLGRQAA